MRGRFWDTFESMSLQGTAVELKFVLIPGRLCYNGKDWYSESRDRDACSEENWARICCMQRWQKL